MAPDALAAADSREVKLAPPRAAAEHTLISLGPLAIKMQTSSIVLGAADGAGDGPAGPYGPTVSSFAAARESGIYSVAGSAKAALTLSFDLGDFLANAAGRVPIPMGGSAGRQLQAALSLQAGGKLSLNVGSSFVRVAASSPDYFIVFVMPPLFALLSDAPVALAWQSEDLLCRLAGEKSPTASVGPGTDAATPLKDL